MFLFLCLKSSFFLHRRTKLKKYFFCTKGLKNIRLNATATHFQVCQRKVKLLKKDGRNKKKLISNKRLDSRQRKKSKQAKTKHKYSVGQKILIRCPSPTFLTTLSVFCRFLAIRPPIKKND